MKKVVYVVTKVGRDSDTRCKGVGYITDSGDLITACVSKKQKTVYPNKHRFNVGNFVKIAEIAKKGLKYLTFSIRNNVIIIIIL